MSASNTKSTPPVADPLTRRRFISRTALSAMGAALGASIPFGRNLPAGLVPVALAEAAKPFRLDGKHPELVILNDRPINAETPAHLLDDDVTPADRLFVRNNGHPPESVDVAKWTLTIDGEAVKKARTFSLAQLKADFATHTYQLQLECGGNGRSEFNPPARGNQWSTGAIGCPSWTGARLADVLAVCDVDPKTAVYIGYQAADAHLTRGPGKVAISRGVPMAKALQDETLLAWAMNGKQIPAMHGHPLRLVCGGWPASASGKWLTGISVRDRVHDGAKMGQKSYRVPCRSVAPGEKVTDEEMCIIESMPVKSLVTFPKSGITHRQKTPLKLRGHAWAGELEVASVDVSIDFGQTWSRCALAKAPNRLAWQRWSAQVTFPDKGYFEVWARATDSRGRAQPMIVPGWNPKGYLNNACHRIAVRAV